MKLLETARVILNTEEVDGLIKSIVEDHPNLKEWFEKTFRKWALNNGPASPSANKNVKGLPDWLANQPAFNSDIKKLKDVADSITDYLENLVSTKGTNSLKLGVEPAVIGSEKWHKGLANKKVELPQDKGGVKTVLPFSSGYRWVQLLTAKSMEDEGNAMGHCVGNGYYHQQHLLGNFLMFSLRDHRDVPHITLNSKARSIVQIQGTANQPVKKEYQSYLIDFFAWFLPKSVSSQAIEKSNGAYQLFIKARASTYNGLQIWLNGDSWYIGGKPKNNYDNWTEAEIEAMSGYLKDNATYKNIWEFPIYYLDSVRSLDLITKKGVSTLVLDALKVDALLVTHEVIVGYIHEHVLHLDFEIPGPLEESGLVPVFESIIKNGFLIKSVVDKDNKVVSSAEKFFKGLQIAKSNSINDLLATLDSPTLEEIYKTRKSDPKESIYTSIGIPTGGTSKKAYALVLALCINEHPKEASDLLKEKPHALKNWTGILTNTSGMSPDVAKLLKNEYMTLIPYMGDPTISAMYKDQKQNAEMHRNLWGQNA